MKEKLIKLLSKVFKLNQCDCKNCGCQKPVEKAVEAPVAPQQPVEKKKIVVVKKVKDTVKPVEKTDSEKPVKKNSKK